jgi:hypothetical protein
MQKVVFLLPTKPTLYLFLRFLGHERTSLPFGANISFKDVAAQLIEVCSSMKTLSGFARTWFSSS